MSTRVRIKVTQSDIERALRNNSYACVVAQAVARTVPDATRIEVDTQTIRMTTEGERRIYLTPYAVQGYVIAFDAGDPLEPFEFALRDPKRIRVEARTPEAKQASREAARARAAVRKAARTSSSKGAVDEAAKVKKAAQAAYAEVRTGGEISRTVSGSGHGPPRVFKRKTRSYGHRLLRINQEA